jgi:RNA polymerase sigma-70 factor (ECF subfamily)
MTGQAIAMPAAIGGHDEPPATRLGALFDTHHQRLYRLARRLSRGADDAHDLVQETFLRAAKSPQSIPSDGPTSEEAWLVRILINICRDRWRWSAVRAKALADGSVEGPRAVDPEPALMARAMVQNALQRLAPRRRAALVLYELEGVPVNAIARMLGVTAITVRWHLSIGRREMARILGAGERS